MGWLVLVMMVQVMVVVVMLVEDIIGGSYHGRVTSSSCSTSRRD